MNQRQKMVLAGFGILLAVTVALGLWFRVSQKEVDGVELEYNGEMISISCEELDQEVFSGELVNGKGERTAHEYKGVELSQLLKKCDVKLEQVSFVEIISADNYSAQLEGDEVREVSRVYLAVEVDGQTVEGIDEGAEGAQLIVFGDSDSKRCVRYVKYIKVSV